MKTVKIFLSASSLVLASMLNAEDKSEFALKLPTQFGVREFTAQEPDAEEILKLFDLDNSRDISQEERENLMPILVQILPKIKGDAERTIFLSRITKHWKTIPSHMSFFMDESWPLIRSNFPPYPPLPDPKLGDSIEVLTNPKNKRILVAESATFPPRFDAPKPTIVSTLETPFQIKKRFDKNRDGVLDENEAKELLLEMRFKFTLAKSNGAREKIVERYAAALTEFDATEFVVNWGMDSTFKIFKDPMSGVWQADARPLTPIPFGKHPSTNFIKQLHDKDPSGLALAEFFNMLQRSNPLERSDIIAKELRGYLAKDYPQGGSPEWFMRVENIGYAFANDGKEIIEHDVERMIEYINDRHENVFAPIFYTDPASAVDFLAKISYENQKNLSHSEREALDSYFKSKK